MNDSLHRQMNRLALSHDRDATVILRCFATAEPEQILVNNQIAPAEFGSEH